MQQLAQSGGCFDTILVLLFYLLTLNEKDSSTFKTEVKISRRCDKKLFNHKCLEV